MSTPEDTGAGRPLRTSGLVLFGLAVAASLIGVVGVATGDAQTPASQRPLVTSASQSAGNEPTVPLLAATPTPTPTTSPAPSPAPPDSAGGSAAPASPAAGAEVADGKPDYRGEARVYNNSTISGLASRAADDLTAAGWTVVEVANYSGGKIPTSTVYYQEGTDQRATAEAIGAEFGMRVEPRFAGITNARPGVIVIVTNDYGT